MSVKVKLEKDGEIVYGFTGFSWTIFFFGFWVPAFRKKSKGLGLFFLFFIIKVILIVMAVRQNLKIAESMIQYGTYDISYSMLTPTLLLSATFSIEIWLAYYYNKYYTTNLLLNGYYTLENDEYSEAILKDYTYLPYTKEELENKAKMERYKEIATFVRKEEQSKAKTYIGILVIIYALFYILTYFNIIDLSNY